MQEYVTDAIVLKKDPLGDLDGRYTLFTTRFGKIIAKAKSSRKITSKLASHLEPGIVTKVRFIETKGTQLIDALKSGRVALPLGELQLLNQIIPDAEPEPALPVQAESASVAAAQAASSRKESSSCCSGASSPRPL